MKDFSLVVPVNTFGLDFDGSRLLLGPLVELDFQERLEEFDFEYERAADGPGFAVTCTSKSNPTDEKIRIWIRPTGLDPLAMSNAEWMGVKSECVSLFESQDVGISPVQNLGDGWFQFQVVIGDGQFRTHLLHVTEHRLVKIRCFSSHEGNAQRMHRLVGGVKVRAHAGMGDIPDEIKDELTALVSEAVAAFQSDTPIKGLRLIASDEIRQLLDAKPEMNPITEKIQRQMMETLASLDYETAIYNHARPGVQFHSIGHPLFHYDGSRWYLDEGSVF
ncbi:MAG: hypothetical protein AAGD07_07365 [Planctomycetota bacterium]